MQRTRRLVGVVTLVSALSCRGRDSITLTLENVGQVSLDSVVVFTTGRAYPVGTLARGALRAGTQEHLPAGQGRMNAGTTSPVSSVS